MTKHYCDVTGVNQTQRQHYIKSVKTHLDMKSFSMSGLSFSRGRGSLCPYNVDSEAYPHINQLNTLDAVLLTRMILAQGRAVTALAAPVAAEATTLTPDIQTGDDLGDGDVIRSS